MLGVRSLYLQLCIVELAHIENQVVVVEFFHIPNHDLQRLRWGGMKKQTKGK